MFHVHWGEQDRGRHTARSNASLVMATWTPCEHLGEQTDRHKQKHYLPATSLASGKYIMYMSRLRVTLRYDRVSFPLFRRSPEFRVCARGPHNPI